MQKSLGSMLSGFVPLLAAILILGLQMRTAAVAAEVSPEVGVSSREFSDPERSNWAGTGPRPLRVTLWYPSEGGGAVEFVPDGDRHVQVLRDGNIAPSPAKHPLILLSPGSGSNAEQLFWLGHFLAQHHFIVAAVSHNGTDEEELRTGMLTATDFFCWERARDVSVVLTRLLADSELSPKIDAARIGAAGFSLGGATALWLGGARLNLELLRQDSPPPQPALVPSIERFIAYSQNEHAGRESIRRAEISYKDPRIQSLFALAPAIGAGFTEGSLREVDVPVCIVVGDADKVAPAATNAKGYADHIPNAQLIVVSGERGHYLAPIPPEQRRMELREVAELALEFFQSVASDHLSVPAVGER